MRDRIVLAMERVGPARAPALPGWDPWNPARITAVTSALPEPDGSSLACSSPFGSADRSGRTPEIRQCGQGCPRTKGSLVSVLLQGFRSLPGLPSARAFLSNLFRPSTPEPPCFHRSRPRFLEPRKTFRESANFAVPAESRQDFTPPVRTCAPGAPHLATTGSAAGHH